MSACCVSQYATASKQGKERAQCWQSSGSSSTLWSLLASCTEQILRHRASTEPTIRSSEVHKTDHPGSALARLVRLAPPLAVGAVVSQHRFLSAQPSPGVQLARCCCRVLRLRVLPMAVTPRLLDPGSVGVSDNGINSRAICVCMCVCMVGGDCYVLLN